MGIVLKLLVVVGVVLVAVWALMGRGRQLRKPEKPEDTPRSNRRDTGGLVRPQDMVHCARCGVHLPASEAVVAGMRHYCGPEHRDADRPG